MKLDEYQKQAKKFAVPEIQSSIVYAALGLSSEAGEVAGKVKKLLRDGDVSLNDIAAEVGDCLWYIAQLSTVLGIPLSELAERNLHKLSDRALRDAVRGSGDNR